MNPTWGKINYELFRVQWAMTVHYTSLRVGRLLLQHGIHIDPEERPEDLRVLHQKIREPRESLHR